MGGLAGLIHFRGDAPDPSVVARMSQRLAHRGPDAEGSFAEGPVVLGHRLRRLTPTRSAQPVVADDVVLMLDGWIYDHEAAAREAGHSPEHGVDTASLLHAWRSWGLDFPAHLEGDYAVAIWDRRARTLYLVRDRMGIKPLYWARDGHRFAFASEIPALLDVPWVSSELQRRHLAELLSFKVVHAPRTLLRDVHLIEPAHWLTVHADQLRTRRYWSPRYAPVGTKPPSDATLIDGLEEAVRRSVRRRLHGGADTGLYLSGGLGSTAIAAAARKLHRQVPSFTVSFDDDPFPESPFAGRVARLLGTDHQDVAVGTPELAAAFAPTVKALGHPFANPAALLQLLLARSASARVRVVLSGDGGEELFGGRMLNPVVRGLRAAQLFARLPAPTRALLSRTLGQLARGRKITTPLEHYGLDLGLGGSKLFGLDERRALLRDPELVREHVRTDVLAPFYANLDTDPVNAILHAYLRSWLGDGSLARADRTAAAAGLDIRFPLLDRDVIRRAAALPGSMKIRRVGGALHTRWPLRALLDGVLPPALLNRPKRGMPTPLDHWLMGPGRLFLEDRFAHLKRDPDKLWRPEFLESLRSRVLKGEPGVGIRLWALFIFDTWRAGLRDSGPTAS